MKKLNRPMPKLDDEWLYTSFIADDHEAKATKLASVVPQLTLVKVVGQTWPWMTIRHPSSENGFVHVNLKELGLTAYYSGIVKYRAPDGAVVYGEKPKEDRPPILTGVDLIHAAACFMNDTGLRDFIYVMKHNQGTMVGVECKSFAHFYERHTWPDEGDPMSLILSWLERTPPPPELIASLVASYNILMTGPTFLRKALTLAIYNAKSTGVMK